MKTTGPKPTKPTTTQPKASKAVGVCAAIFGRQNVTSVKHAVHGSQWNAAHTHSRQAAAEWTATFGNAIACQDHHPDVTGMGPHKALEETNVLN